MGLVTSTIKAVDFREAFTASWLNTRHGHQTGVGWDSGCACVALSHCIWKLEMIVSVPQGCHKDYMESTAPCVWLLGREF